MLVVYITNSYTVGGLFTATYGGVSMILLQTNASSTSNSHLFYLVGAPPSTNNLVINSAGNFERMSLTVYMLNGVNQTTPIQGAAYTLNGFGNACSQTLTTSLTSTCLDFISVVTPGTITNSLNQVTIIDGSNTPSNQSTWASVKQNGGSNNMGYTWTNNSNFQYMAISVNGIATSSTNNLTTNSKFINNDLFNNGTIQSKRTATQLSSVVTAVAVT